MYFVGIAGHLIEPVQSYMLLLTPFTLLFLGILVLREAIVNKNFLLWLVITYVTTLFLEVIGAKTGLVFGEYSYGTVLGFKLFDVPLIIGLNWVIVIWGGILIAKRISENKYITALIAATIAVVFDFFLEPVAIKLGYWTWADVSVPIQNYAAWFIIAFIFAYLFSSKNIDTPTKIPAHYFAAQLIFFFILNLFIS
jgi:putative membrane protein